MGVPAASSLTGLLADCRRGASSALIQIPVIGPSHTRTNLSNPFARHGRGAAVPRGCCLTPPSGPVGPTPLQQGYCCLGGAGFTRSAASVSGTMSKSSSSVHRPSLKMLFTGAG